ncbi:MAG: adenylate/guanylate cyclase domain-containing protein [Bacteroidota bacterium]
MTKSKNFKRRLFRNKVLVISGIYVVVSLFITFYNRSILLGGWLSEPARNFNTRVEFVISLSIGLIAGVVGGSILVQIYEKVFKKKSFGFSWMVTALFFVSLFLVTFVTVNLIVYSAQFRVSGDHTAALEQTLNLTVAPPLLSTFLLWGFIVVLTVFFLQINDKFGPGVLRKFIRGDYHQPKVEERVFMFLDMRSSTVIAEKLGNTTYFNLIQEVFIDLTDPIISKRGEIYQYVGDEVIISWDMKRKEAPTWALECYFEVQKRIESLSEKYTEKFGVRPEFKAGIHHGLVTAGEIGSIKKDIAYSGDVLNTTARIQAECNKFGVDIILSEKTKNLVEGDWNFHELGKIQLRGKEEKVGLFSVRLE